MNTIAHLVAMLAFLWAAVYCFGTLDVHALGYVFIGLFMLFIPLTIAGAFDDWDIIRGGKHQDEG